MIVDTHCHLTYQPLCDRLESVIADAAAAGVKRLITIGTSPDDAERARAIAHRHPEVYFSVGVHPLHSHEVADHQLPRVAEIASDPRCVAFGEMGLDYHYDQPPRPRQQEVFQAQLQIIRCSRIAKPVIIHCRKAVDDTLAMLHAGDLPMSRFVFHCFTEPPGEARKVIDAGCRLSFTGIVTYKNAQEVRESAMRVPLDRIMVETDSPFLTPEPHRKVRTNEPKYAAATVKFLADLRGVSEEEMARITTENARRFFGVDLS